MLKADATKELEAPRCYIPIWVPVESPSEKIQRAKEDLAASSITEDLVESNGKSPKSQRERKKSKSKSGEEKSADEGEKLENTEGLPVATSAGDSQSPLKKSPEKSSKSPKKSVGEEEPNTVQN